MKLAFILFHYLTVVRAVHRLLGRFSALTFAISLTYKKQKINELGTFLVADNNLTTIVGAWLGINVAASIVTLWRGIVDKICHFTSLALKR